MCIWDSYVYQKGVLCFLIRKSYVRSVKRYRFVRKYAAIPVQLEIFILQFIGGYVLIIWAFFVNRFYCFWLLSSSSSSSSNILTSGQTGYLYIYYNSKIAPAQLIWNLLIFHCSKPNNDGCFGSGFEWFVVLCFRPIIPATSFKGYH